MAVFIIDITERWFLRFVVNAFIIFKNFLQWNIFSPNTEPERHSRDGLIKWIWYSAGGGGCKK